MPNHVYNVIKLDRIEYSDLLESRVAAYFDLDYKLNFSHFIPQPPQIYRGPCTQEDEKDMPCNWYNWNVVNWGTKWNAYESKTYRALSTKENSVYIVLTFQTAWSPPYPVASAIMNRFRHGFKHYYRDEGDNFYGVDIWRWNKDSQVGTRSKHYFPSTKTPGVERGNIELERDIKTTTEHYFKGEFDE